MLSFDTFNTSVLPIAVGFLAALFMVVAKYGIASLVLYKNNKFFWALTVVICEVSLFVTVYVAITHLKLDGLKFLGGFLFGLVTLLLFCVIKHKNKL